MPWTFQDIFVKTKTKISFSNPEASRDCYRSGNDMVCSQLRSWQLQIAVPSKSSILLVMQQRSCEDCIELSVDGTRSNPVLATTGLSVRLPSVRPSVTRWHCVKTTLGSRNLKTKVHSLRQTVSNINVSIRIAPILSLNLRRVEFQVEFRVTWISTRRFFVIKFTGWFAVLY